MSQPVRSLPATPTRRLASLLAVVAVFGVVGIAFCAPAPSAAPSAAEAVYPKPQAEMEKLARRDPLAFLQLAHKWAQERLKTYTCQFRKVERIDGELRKPETMRMKFRTDPLSIYVKWIADPSKGQEAIYVKGANKDEVVVHPSGLLGLLIRKVNIDPESKTALKYSRRPITCAGMTKLLGFIIPECERAKTNGDLTLTYEGLRQDGGRPSYTFKRVLPKGKDYPCEVLIIYIDTEYLVCVRTDSYDWDGNLISHYFYTDLQINADLKDDDFDPDNRDYAYRLF